MSWLPREIQLIPWHSEILVETLLQFEENYRADSKRQKRHQRKPPHERNTGGMRLQQNISQRHARSSDRIELVGFAVLRPNGVERGEVRTRQEQYRMVA